MGCHVQIVYAKNGMNLNKIRLRELHTIPLTLSVSPSVSVHQYCSLSLSLALSILLLFIFNIVQHVQNLSQPFSFYHCSIFLWSLFFYESFLFSFYFKHSLFGPICQPIFGIVVSFIVISVIFFQLFLHS